MKLKLIHIVLFLISNLFVNGQEIDTSYTVYSSYKKYIKHFSNLEIVQPHTFKNVNEKKNLIYKEIGDRKLHLDAFYNKKNQEKPAVVLIHGGGWKSGNKSHMEPMAQYIASKGYACFTIEYRLSLEAIYPAGIFDVKQAIQYIKLNAKKFHVDKNKVVILGCSSGGQMAALIGTTNNNNLFEDINSPYNQSTSVQAIIDLDGVIAFIHPKSSEGTMASLWLGGTSKEKQNTWLQASALTHVDKNTPPILFICSQYERFHAGRDDMIQILNKYNTYSQVETFSESPHTFWLFYPWFTETVNYITNFLDKTLKQS